MEWPSDCHCAKTTTATTTSTKIETDVELAAAVLPLSTHSSPPSKLQLDVIVVDDEKCDVDPENSKKSDVVTPSDATTADDISLNDNHEDESTPVLPTEEHNNSDNRHCDTVGAAALAPPTTTPSKAFAYTIDFDDGPVDTKKKMDFLERFQKRHKRGVSLSKLDDDRGRHGSPVLESKFTKPPMKKTVTISKPNVSDVTVRLRDKSRLCAPDLSDDHRHSWSPRSSQEVQRINYGAAPLVNRTSYDDDNEDERDDDDDDDEVNCLAPPLDFQNDNDSVSDAGTYTLDGDNYTEEQKTLMSIDKFAKLTKETAASTTHVSTVAAASVARKKRNDSIEVIDLESTTETAPITFVEKSKKTTSYLERIKSKVKTISDRTFHKNRSPDTDRIHHVSTPPPPPPPQDIGNFTSITASGAFSKNKSYRPKAHRKSSLTKSQIDSSEYIQKIDEKLLNSFTDYEKAQHNEYQLNMFSENDESKPFMTASTAAAQSLMRTSKTESQLSASHTTTASYGLDVAETKNDWIQEWAKNARRNTRKQMPTLRASSERPSSCRRNYHVREAEENEEIEFGDNLDRNYSQRKNVNRYDDTGNTSCMNEELFLRYELRQQQQQPQVISGGRPQTAVIAVAAAPTDCMMSSSEFGDMDDDMSLMPLRRSHEASDRLRREFFNCSPTTAARPPMSPTKIPSPMHSMTRPRSVNRSLHSSITVSVLFVQFLIIMYKKGEGRRKGARPGAILQLKKEGNARKGKRNKNKKP